MLTLRACVYFTGYTRADAVGKNCRFLQGKATVPESVKAVRAAIDKGEQVFQLLRNYSKSGRVFDNLLYLKPVFDEDLSKSKGKPRYFFGVQFDVTPEVPAGRTVNIDGPPDTSLVALVSVRPVQLLLPGRAPA